MNNNSKVKKIELLTKLVVFILLIVLIVLPIWFFTIFGSLLFSILVFAYEMLILLGFIIGDKNNG